MSLFNFQWFFVTEAIFYRSYAAFPKDFRRKEFIPLGTRLAWILVWTTPFSTKPLRASRRLLQISSRLPLFSSGWRSLSLRKTLWAYTSCLQVGNFPHKFENYFIRFQKSLRGNKKQLILSCDCTFFERYSSPFGLPTIFQFPYFISVSLL
jgi:hypothetical protein